nr:PREDICTED: uncharacterized protein LOC109031992 [Bemisia tabaci]
MSPQPFEHLKEPIKYLTDPKLVALKNKRREELREEFFRKKLSPYSVHQEGSIFDPAIQRYLSTLAHMEDYYKATPKTVTYGLGVLFVPMGIIAYFFKRDKDRQELELRTGQIAYRDRHDKFA